MKQTSIRIIILLIITIFSFTSVTYAADTKTGVKVVTTQAESEMPADVTEETDVTIDNSTDDTLLPEKTEPIMCEPLKATTLLTSAISMPAYKNYTVPAGSITLVPVYSNYGGLMYFDATSDKSNTNPVKVYLCKTKEDAVPTDDNTIKYYDVKDLTAGNMTLKACGKGMPVSNGVQYYIAIYNNTDNSADATVSIRAYVLTTGTRTLYQGNSKWTLSSGRTQSGKANTVWYRFVPGKTGVASVYLKEFGNDSSSGYVTLYNGKRTVPLSETLWYDTSTSSNRVFFGVKKGVAYYLKVSTCSGDSANNYKYGIFYNVASYTDRALGYKSKAMRIYRKKAATTTLFTAANANYYDWYKFYVPYKKSTRVTIDARNIKTGYLSVKFYKGSKYIDTVTVDANSLSSINLTCSSTWGKAAKGTYYAKVIKSKKANGKYTIRHTY